MEPSNTHPFLRPGRLNTYTAYSIACFVAWTVFWAIVLAKKSNVILGYRLRFFMGWVVGWTSATIARAIYPPPKKWRSVDPTSDLDA